MFRTFVQPAYTPNHSCTRRDPKRNLLHLFVHRDCTAVQGTVPCKLASLHLNGRVRNRGLRNVQSTTAETCCVLNEIAIFKDKSARQSA